MLSFFVHIFSLLFLRFEKDIRLIHFLNLPAFICSKSTMETPEQYILFKASNKDIRMNLVTGVFTVNFKQILHTILVFSPLTLNKYFLAGKTFHS